MPYWDQRVEAVATEYPDVSWDKSCDPAWKTDPGFGVIGVEN